MDVIANFIIFGYKEIYKDRKGVFYEILLQVVFLAGYLNYKLHPDQNAQDIKTLELLCMISLFRTLRLMYLLLDFKQFYTLTETLSKFTMPLITMTLSIYIVFFFYATIGQSLFGGRVTMGSA